LKEQARRVVSLFPRYVEKSSSKAHSQFLFGMKDPSRVFSDYKRYRFEKKKPPMELQPFESSLERQR